MIDGVRIDELNPAFAAYLDQLIPIMREGATGHVTVLQVATLIVAMIVDGAPETLDTLDEIAAALGDNENLAATLTASIALKANIAGPTFTGVASSTTPPAGNSSTRIATTAFVQTALQYPAVQVALNYLRRNAANTAFEARTPAQTATDIGISAFGATLVDDTSAAAARATLGVPNPTASVGVVGEWVDISSASGGLAAVLPAGGTWAYHLLRLNGTSGALASKSIGVAAGGSTVGPAAAGEAWWGMGWRIA